MASGDNARINGSPQFMVIDAAGILDAIWLSDVRIAELTGKVA